MPPEPKFNLGVIEGFFGKAWDWSARFSGADFLSDWGYGFYIYTPKADPFLRRRWREQMPVQSMQHLSELNSRCQHRGISLGIGLTPFEIYLDYDSRAKATLRSKVLQLNEIQAEMLCILFDDMRGDVMKGHARLSRTRSIDVYVSRLRCKLEVDIRSPKIVQTVGNGYKFSAAVTVL